MEARSFQESLLLDVQVENLLVVTSELAQWVRSSGSAEERLAFESLESRLRSYGLQTRLIEHEAFISLPGAAQVEVEGESYPAITHSFSAPTEGLEAKVAEWNGGVEESSAVRGKIALLRGLAGPPRVLAAEEAGAVGQIYVNGPITHEMIVSPVWGSPGTQDLSHLPTTPVLSVNDETARHLWSAATTGSHVRIRADVDTGWRVTPILVADLPVEGTDDFVLFSGHVDSWHYGAMDNGTANATQVEVARIMAEHRNQMVRGLRLAFWSGHSHGRYSSSAWYADTYWFDLYRHCVAHVNVDSVGGLNATNLSSGLVNASTHDLARDAINAVTEVDFRGSRASRMGDQSFLGLGIPSLWVSLSLQEEGGLGWWWHTTEDTIDKIDPELLVRDARIYTVAVSRLLTEPLLPLRAGAEAREVRDVLASLSAQVSGLFDLSEVLAWATDLTERAEQLDTWATMHPDPTEGEARVYNRTVSGVLRSLLPVNHTRSGRFRPDPALNLPALPLLAPATALPGLSADGARHLRVDLVRARNEVAFALDRARDEVERGLAELTTSGG